MKSGGAVFDPLMIFYQIISMQCFYYLAMGTMLGFFHILFNVSVSLDHFFTPSFVDLARLTGWIEAARVVLTSLIGAWLLSIVVERSKKCVDFTFTLFFLHMIICTCYKQFPLSWEWWLCQVVASVLMATFGELLCARKELQDIPLYAPTSHV